MKLKKKSSSFRHSAGFLPRKTDSVPEGFFFHVHFCFSFKLVWKPVLWKLEDMSSPSFVITFPGSQISLSPALGLSAVLSLKDYKER